MRVLALLAAFLVLAGAPAVAAAQSAGDDQYVDPFAGQDAGGSGAGGKTGSAPSASAPSASAPSTSAPSASAPSTSAPASAPSTSAPASSAPSSSAPAASAPSVSSAPVQVQLPYTGGATAYRALLGAVLLLAGVALRLRVPDVPRRR